MPIQPALDGLEPLTARIDALERRVAVLESSTALVNSQSGEVAHRTAMEAPVRAISTEANGGPAVSGMLSLFGAALLGIAGAYVLRAVSGANLLPRAVVAGIAGCYATGWLAASAYDASRRLRAALFAATSVLIFAPMLWEMSIRFHATSAAGAAAYIVVYAAVATVMALRFDRDISYTIAISGCSIVAVALCVATHEMALFAAVLLAMCAVGELSTLRRRSPVARVIVCLCADFSIWALLRIYSLPPAEQSDYPPLNPALILGAAGLLFATQLMSLTAYAIGRTEPLGVIGVCQPMISFALLVLGMAHFIPGHSAQAIGLLCLLLAVAGYVAAYGPFPGGAGSRNHAVFIAWSCALSFASVFLLVSHPLASVILGLAAVAAVPLASRVHANSIAVQGVLFLCAAAFASGLIAYAGSSLVGSIQGLPSWPVALVAGSALLCYFLQPDKPREPALSQAIDFLQAIIAALGVAALAVRGLVGAFALVLVPGAGHIAVLRTVALCAAAVVLSWLGARLGRVQMARVAYVALAVAAAKLLFEDLRLGRMEFIAVSVFLLAVTFLSVSRLAPRLPVRQDATRG